jgi:putative tricarboxylic transport membrane protein
MDTNKSCQNDVRHGRPNWGALIFACLLAAAVLFYAWSVLDVARRTTDWLLILPGALLAAIAFVWAGVADWRVRRTMSDIADTARGAQARPVLLIVLTLAFACTAPFIGFDLGAAIFILLCLLVQGERCWWKLAMASVGGAAVMAWIFVDLLMVRLPVLFL